MRYNYLCLVIYTDTWVSATSLAEYLFLTMRTHFKITHTIRKRNHCVSINKRTLLLSKTLKTFVKSFQRKIFPLSLFETIFKPFPINPMHQRYSIFFKPAFNGRYQAQLQMRNFVQNLYKRLRIFYFVETCLRLLYPSTICPPIK